MAAVSATMAVCLAIPITVFLVLFSPGSRAQLPGQVDSTLKAKGAGLLKNLNPVNRLKADSNLLHKPSIAFPKTPMFSSPWVALKGGYINYTYNYRSSIDTPFAENNIGQHNATGYLNVLIGNRLPLKVNYWLRRSNSALFRDITDVQVVFDPAGFRENRIRQMKEQLLAQVPQLQDSLLEKTWQSKLQQLKNMGNSLKAPFTIQQVREYRELIQKPSIGYDIMQPDSVNKRKSDSTLAQAKEYIALYDSSKQVYAKLSTQVDSLEKAVTKMHRRIQQYRQVINGSTAGDWSSYTKWQQDLKQYQPQQPTPPDKFKWLMGIKTMSAGKSPVNYSELTAKNLGVTGVNVEYNTWWYLAVTAGVVNYRFRDFVVNRLARTPQYLYMLRLGLGRLEKNYFIVSGFRGRKQLYASTDNGNAYSSINITGLSAEAKWRLNRNSYVIAEAAQSLSPDYRANPPENDGKLFNWNNNTNKALSFKGYSYLPATSSRLEGMYKFTGANYQSFSSFQTNAAVRSWYVKFEQPFFKRQLRLSASLRSNEFTNPYIVQQYKSNTVFKSITAVFRARKWPTITLGYIPMSQLTMVGQQLLESRFQTLTGSFSHFYQLGTKHASTMLVVNKFFSNSSDTGFIYFNATNIYATQQFLFRQFTAGLGLSYSSNGQYILKVMDGSLNLYVWKKNALGFGVKVNNFNKETAKLGSYINANIRISKRDMLYMSYEKGYLPGNNKQLVGNVMASIQLSRYF